MSTLSLLSLPAEVRLNIYSYLFDDESLHIDSTSPKPQQELQIAPILRTCRYLRDEASPSFFSRVNVHFNVGKDVPATNLIHWMESVGESNVRLLRNFTMRWENYVDISLELKGNVRGLMLKDDIASSSPAPPTIELPSIMLGTQILFQAPTINPTSSTRVGQKHILTMKGVEGPEDRKAYWKRNGTADFCDALTKHLSPRIGATLENRTGSFMTTRELVEFVDDASRHAGGLRWLWYW